MLRIIGQIYGISRGTPYMAHFWQNFMVVDSCIQYLWSFWNGTLDKESRFFGSKPLKICYYIKDSFAITQIFCYNSEIDSKKG